MNLCIQLTKRQLRFAIAIIGLALFLSVNFKASDVHAQEFRIASQVYLGEDKLPVSENLTLFSERIVYDFQMSDDAQPKPVQTVIFDSRTRMMVLLDPARQVRLELPELRLIRILDAVRRETLQDNRTSFLVKDQFKEHNDWSTDWVKLESPQITYSYKGLYPKNAAILPVYYEFLDNFTKLNATDPTKIPPFARIQLNNSIRRNGRIPVEVQISVKQNALFKKGFSAKSKHVVIDQLSDKDKQRIAQAKTEWQTFTAVNLTEYRGLKPNPIIKPKRKPKGEDSKVVTASHSEPDKTGSNGKR